MLASLERTRWYMKATVALASGEYEINFTYNGKNYSTFSLVKESGEPQKIYADDDLIYDASNPAKWIAITRYIYIAGGNDASASSLISWFDNNGEQKPLLLQPKTATPTDEEQVILPDAEYQGLSGVTVQAVASETLIPENIRKGVVIFGVVGTFEHEPDENLIPENIKKGVEILGVTGTFDGFDPSNPIAQMTNLAGSGQDQFVHDWAQMAKIQLHEQGVSNAFLATDEAQFILAKAVTDLIEDGTLSATTLSLIATLRVNHPHTEDDEEEATQNV